MKTYGIVMAGGSGTRFWPLSRKKKPKQLLNLTGRSLMVNEAIDRLAEVVGSQNIYVVTAQEQAQLMLNATSDRLQTDHILAEPCARNTTACIGYAAVEIVRKHGDGIMIVTPSDHYIQDLDRFTKTLKQAVQTVEETDKLVTIGITPTFPSTGYGYIRYQADASSTAKTVVEFKEKPEHSLAESYIASGDYAWNSGMFIWKASTILRKLSELVPDIYEKLSLLMNAPEGPEELETLNTVYPSLRKISIDYAVMEASAAKGDVLLLPGSFGWNDVGSWDMMSVIHEPDEKGNVALGDVMMLDTTNSVAYSSGRMVATLGVDNIIVVETPDAVLVCNQERAQDIKKIVEALQAEKRSQLL